MTSLCLPFPGIAPDTPRDTAHAPRPTPRGPVLIGDSVIPCDHTTLLLTLWRDWETPRDESE